MEEGKQKSEPSPLKRDRQVSPDPVRGLNHNRAEEDHGKILRLTYSKVSDEENQNMPRDISIILINKSISFQWLHYEK